ncbi:hypothetical protein BU25DRAFT_8812 [Macroventuria anomochaeta]|uniref:Uncharacterized protein n=1 Tax=Macroventuria anomochaeta TaxID=301207 RepID=A0ACB6SJW0_9PLEO|nr:uncharacterized protein BU25DRAFT_8812 [Macroventuria anomochaeta]KAF2633577.1 hypothetical protein BU25DRAFT_8812 [Macroventuria anomochaeta]
MQEAQDLKRISYLAFLFVTLTLTSSFFGMNVKELNSDPTALWVFVVSALAILFGSMFVVWLSGSPMLSVTWKGIASFFGGIKDELIPAKQQTWYPFHANWFEHFESCTQNS